MPQTKRRKNVSNHWARVTAEIRRKTGYSWIEAKKIYDILRAEKAKPPSLNLAKRITRKKYSAYKGKVTKQERKWIEQAKQRLKEKQKARKKPVIILPQKPKIAPSEKALPQGKLRLAPPGKPKPQAKEPSRRKGRTQFERFCAKYGAVYPAHSGMKKTIEKQWRNPEWQEKLAKTLADARKSIVKHGYVNTQVRKRLRRLLEQIGIDELQDFWYGLLRTIYA